MNNKPALAAILMCSALSGAHANADDLKKLLSGRRAAPAEAARTLQSAQPSQTQTSAALAAADAAACPKSGATGELGAVEMFKSALTRTALSAAARELKVDELQLPASIDNVCVAQKRLAYVQRATSRWSVNVISSIQQAKQALDIKQEIDSYQAFKGNPDFGKASDKDIARLRKDLKHDLQQIEAAIKEKRKANAEMLGEASTNMRAALVNGSLIGGWDKRLLEFMGDNGKWAYANAQSVKLFTDHVGLLGSTARSMSSVLEAQSASTATVITAANDKKASALLKQREQENLAFEKEIANELRL
jgi:hypothetical protein